MTVRITDPPDNSHFPYDEGWEATVTIDSSDAVDGTILDHRYIPAKAYPSDGPFCIGGPDANGLYTWIVPFTLNPPNPPIQKSDPVVILCYDSEGPGAASVKETASAIGPPLGYFLLKLSEAERHAEEIRRAEFDKMVKAEKVSDAQREAEEKRRTEFNRRVEAEKKAERDMREKAERRELAKLRDDAPSISIDRASLDGDDVNVTVTLKPAGTQGVVFLMLMNPATTKTLPCSLPIKGQEGQDVQRCPPFQSIHAEDWTDIQVMAVTKGHVAPPAVRVIKPPPAP